MLRLSLFGGFALASADGGAVVIASRKCRALLAFLAMQRRPAPRERVAWLLWGEGGEARARGSLRQALTTLRREVPEEEPWLLATVETVAVDHQQLWVDALDADALLAAGEARRALELCGRGEFLAGLSLNAAEFDEWREGEQRRWRERETAGLHALVDQARKAGQHRALLSIGRRLLKLEPWSEEAHRAVMWALSGLGRHAEALRQYQLARDALRAELNVAPSAETERLLMEIRSTRSAPAPTPEMAQPLEAPPESSAPPEPAAPLESGVPSREEPVIGREVERRQIDGLLQGCQSSGRGHVIVIRGEAGMGKSVFLRHALDRARESGFAPHVMQAGEYGTGRNLEVVRSVLGALGAPERTPAAHKLAIDELLGISLDPTGAGVAAALDPGARAQAESRAIEALVAAAGIGQRRVIAVEDLHWCDAETVRLLCTLAGAAPSHGHVVVFTCRSGEEPVDLAWAGLFRKGSLTSIDLGPLTDQEAARLAERYPERDAELTRRCVERAGGHPLFLVQLLESGPFAAAVPQSMQDAVLARLSRVPPSDRRLLDAAAVLAAPFSLEQIARVLEEDPPSPTLLVHRGWLRPAGTGLIIAHDLVAAAICSALDGRTLAALHRRAADWFASRDPLTSAEHLDRAGDRGAAGAYLSVAREALRERRLDLAESVLQRIDACPSDSAQVFEALCLRGDVRRERGDAAGSHAVFARAAGKAQVPERKARAQLGLAAALRLLDRFDEALACLADADAVIAATDHVTRASLEYLRGNLLFSIGDVAGCRSAHERALVHAREADSAVDEVAALSGLGDAWFLAGRVLSAHRAFENCQKLARTHGILRMEAASSVMLGLTELYANELEAAIASAEHAVEIADRIEDLRLQCIAGSVAASLYCERGDFAAVRRACERVQVAARRLGSERLEAMGLDEIARALIEEGRTREALGIARQTLALCERSGGLPVSGPFYLANLARAEEDPQAARAAVARGEALLAAGCPCHNHFGLREGAITIALQTGAWDEARRHAAALESYLGEERTARASLVIEGARLLAEAGENPQAREPRERLAELRAVAERAGLVLLARWFLGPPATFTPV